MCSIVLPFSVMLLMFLLFAPNILVHVYVCVLSKTWNNAFCPKVLFWIWYYLRQYEGLAAFCVTFNKTALLMSFLPSGLRCDVYRVSFEPKVPIRTLTYWGKICWQLRFRMLEIFLFLCLYIFWSIGLGWVWWSVCRSGMDESVHRQ